MDSMSTRQNDTMAHDSMDAMIDNYRKEQDMMDAYDEMLDECYGPVMIGNLTFYPSQILKECGPIAYRIGLSEFEDNLADDDV